MSRKPCWIIGVSILITLCSFSLVTVHVDYDLVAAYPRSFDADIDAELSRWAEQYPKEKVTVSIYWFCGMMGSRESRR